MFIYKTRMFECLGNGLFSDFMKYDASRFFKAELLFYMPRDSFALAVGVGREDYLVGFFGEFLEFGYHHLFARHHFVMRYKARGDVDCFFVAFRQVAHMADRGAHEKVASRVDRLQIFFDGLCLCGRFNNY